MNHSEERCRTFHAAKELSFFTTSISIALFISTIGFNGMIMFILFIRNRNLLHKSMYYKVLLNISIADFLTGLISDTNSISFHAKEGLRIDISALEIKLLHCSLFLINTATVLNIGIFCIDRVMLLCNPLRFRDGLKDWQAVLILVSPWLSAAGLLVPYFFVGYIRYLKIFCFAAVTVTCICLIILIITYRLRLAFHLSFIDRSPLTKRDKLQQKRSYTLESGSSLTSATDDSYPAYRTGTPSFTGDGCSHQRNGINETNKVKWQIGDGEEQQNNNTSSDTAKVGKYGDRLDVICYVTKISNIKTKGNDKNNNKRTLGTGRTASNASEDELRRSAVTEKRVNKTFITMLLVYLGTYLPSAIMTVYINTCVTCSCTLVHVLRDMIYLAILSSAFWRPLNFILRLNTLRYEMNKIIKRISCRWMRKVLTGGLSFTNKDDIPATFSNECFANSCSYNTE